jgi:hypothetical protein
MPSRNPIQPFRHNLVWDITAGNPVQISKTHVPVQSLNKPVERTANQEYYALCDLEEQDGNLGLSILRSSGGQLQNKMIVSRVTGGAAQVWNKICAPEQVIKPGDRLLKVNDVRTTDDAWTSLPGTVAVLTLRRPRVFDVRWRMDSSYGKPLGLHVKLVSCLTWGVRVVSLDDGLVRDWNKVNPSQAVLPSDVIVGINGITNDPQKLEEIINSPTVELDLTVYSWRRLSRSYTFDEARQQLTPDVDPEEETSASDGITELSEVGDHRDEELGHCNRDEELGHCWV